MPIRYVCFPPLKFQCFFASKLYISWCPTLAAPPWCLMHSHDFLPVSPGQLVNLRKAWRKERGKEVILSKPLRPKPRAGCFGANPASHDRPPLSKFLQRMVGQGAFEHAHTMRKGGTRGRVGEKFEFLQSYVTSAEVLTKRHFDGSNMFRAFIASSPWGL